jgi:hypothetical protein
MQDSAAAYASTYLNLRNGRAEQSRAVAYCWQPASTVTLGIEPRWDPWPYISVSRLLFFSSFIVPPLIKGRGWAFFVIGVPLLHLFHPRSHWSRGYRHIIHFHKTQTDSKFYYIQGHLSMQDSASSLCLNLFKHKKRQLDTWTVVGLSAAKKRLS